MCDEAKLSEICEAVTTLRSDYEVHIHPEIEKLLSSVHGPLVDELLDLRDQEQGMAYKVNVLFDDSQDGGVRAKLSEEDKATLRKNRTSILVAVIGAGALIGAAIVGAMSSMAQLFDNHQELTVLVEQLQQSIGG